MDGETLYYAALFTALPLVILSITSHEAAHAYAAYRLGDPTAHYKGRVSLNPIRHIDPFFTLLLPLITMLTAGFAFGGPKPVPINPYLFKKDMRYGIMITGLAGPAVNLAIAIFCALMIRLGLLLENVGVFSPFPKMSFNFLVLVNVGTWNLLLFVFNLIPIPPLDGSRALQYVLPREWVYKYMSIERYGLLIVMLALVTGVLNPLLRNVGRVFGLAAGF